jgi:NADPH:quinone reductase-like Zn-dependent oxidoreductase
MKAVVYERYGAPEVLALRDVAKPIPNDNEILVRVIATTVTSADTRVRSLRIPLGFKTFGRLAFGLTRPRQRVLGSEFAGKVASVGRSVTTFKNGDSVYGSTGIRMGCHAEYLCVSASGAVALKPAALSFAEAASLPFGGSTALDFFKRSNIKPGERVLINGASGSVGTAAVQLAKYHGAHVTGVCSAANMSLVMSLGADAVVDYAREDFAARGNKYEVIVDTVGNAPIARSKAALVRGGRLLLVLCSLPDMLRAPLISFASQTKVIVLPATERLEYVRLLGELAVAGKIKAVIDRQYDISQIVEAHRYVDQGHKRGNVVISVGVV